MILADLPFWFRSVKAKFLLLPQSIFISQIKIRKVSQMLKYLIHSGMFYTQFSARDDLDLYGVLSFLFVLHLLK